MLNLVVALLTMSALQRRGFVPSLTLGLLCLWGSLSPASALFCGSAIVSEGASKPEVLQKCGDPTFAEQRLEYTTVYVSPGTAQVPHPRQPQGSRERTPLPPMPDRSPHAPPLRPTLRDPAPPSPAAPPPVVVVVPPQPVIIAVTIDEWTYNFGPHSLMYRLRFEDGILRSLKTLHYGY